MKVSNWYSIRQTEGYVTISYSMLNRFMSLTVFAIVVSILIYCTFILGWEMSLLSILLMSVVLLVSFFASALSDEYEFDLKKGVLLRTSGVYPFLNKRSIPMSDIREIEIESFENTSFLYHIVKGVNSKYRNAYFSLKLNVKNEEVLSLGAFREDYKHIIDRLKEKVFLMTKGN